MSKVKTISTSSSQSIVSAIRDIGVLMKFKLSLMVVFAAVVGYAVAAGVSFSWLNMILLATAGFLITGSANAINQILERDLDKLMPRTANRPLPKERMTVAAASVIAGCSGVVGISMLAIQFNMLSALLGALALLSYAFIYTPMKRVSPFAVFAGAFPGAISPLIGWVAVTGSLGFFGLTLFAIQFLWQFPHFWAIAWVSDEDYKKAGFNLLPSEEGKSKATATHCIIYSIALLLVSIIPLALNMISLIPGVIIAITGIWFLFKSIQLYQNVTDKAAMQLMFASFLYLPLVFILILIG